MTQHGHGDHLVTAGFRVGYRGPYPVGVEPVTPPTEQVKDAETLAGTDRTAHRPRV